MRATRSEIPRWQERDRDTVYCSTQFPDFAGKIEHAQRSTFVVSAVLTLGMFVQFLLPLSLNNFMMNKKRILLLLLHLASLASSRIDRAHFCISVRRERSTQSQSRMNRSLPVSGTRRDVEPTFGGPSLFSSLRIISPSPIPTLHR